MNAPRTSKIVVALGLACTLLAPAVRAEPLEIAMQGRLTSAGGGPVADGVYAMAVTLFDAPVGGNQVFKELFIAVPVQGGVFALPLGGADSKLDSAVFAGPKPLFVGVTVSNDPELQRQPLRRVPTAAHALQAALAADVQCTGCIGSDDLAKAAVTGEKIATGAVGANHVSFNWAGAESPGGPATFALGANTAKLADSAKNAELASFADESASAKVAKGLQCTGCVTAAALNDAVAKDLVAAGKLAKVAVSGAYADLSGGPDLSPFGLLGKAQTWTEAQTLGKGAKLGADLDAGKNQLLWARHHNSAGEPAKCDSSLEGAIYFDTKAKRFYGCNGSKWLAFTAGVNSQDNPAPSCLALLADGATKSGLYWLKPPKATAARQVWCEQEKNGGGWALVLHVFGHQGLVKGKFKAAVGHLRFTDANWNLTGGNLVVGNSAQPPQPGAVTGAIDIAFFDGGWNDLRAACHTGTGNLSEHAYGLVANFATVNGNHKLLGAAANGKSYPVDKATNSAGNITIWVDNETNSENGGHYLCDTTNGGGNGTTQLSLCYTDFLNNDNSKDMGDSIVALGFGSNGSDGDGWAVGLTGECGAMGDKALGDAGTFSYWVR